MNKVSFLTNLDSSVRLRLKYTHGIGKSKTRRFYTLYKLSDFGHRNLRLRLMADGDRRQLTLYVQKKMGLLSEALKLKKKQAMKKQQQIACYKALRKTLGLPCNGQRTKSNARTCRIISGVYKRREYTLLKRRSSIRLRTEAIRKERKRRAKMIAESIKKLQSEAFGIKRKPKDRKKGMKEKLKRR